MRGALASTGALSATVRAGYEGRQRWAAARDPQGVRARLSGRAPLAALRDIGRRGDVVVGWAR
jgi:prephenate dehydrogenase